MINVALPKGRLGESAYERMAAAGYDCPSILEKNRKLTFENPENCVVLGAGKAIKYIDKIDGRTHGKMNPLVAYY